MLSRRVNLPNFLAAAKKMMLDTGPWVLGFIQHLIFSLFLQPSAFSLLTFRLSSQGAYQIGDV